MSADFPTDAEAEVLAAAAEDALFRAHEVLSSCDGQMEARIIADGIAPLIRAREAAAWDEGYDQGHQAARAVNPEWPDQPTNPYQEADDDRD